MTTTYPIPPVAEEQRLLEQVREWLLEHPEAPGASDAGSLEQMRMLREGMGRAKTEDMAAMLQQYDQLADLVRQIRAGRQVRQVDPECPYFGHLHIRDQRRERDILLGRTARLDGPVTIVDWRNAPISGIFYRYQEGEEFEEQVDDVTLEGRVLARRILGITGGRLHRVDTPGGSWLREKDGWVALEQPHPRLLAATSRLHDPSQRPDARLGTGRQHRADKHLPEIAALIDAQQFDLITQPGSGLVAIRGSAGSGKTTVALHRIAWLNYSDPERFRPGRMLVLVWGRALKNYVAHVLPSLGVDGVQVLTWSEWARRLVKRHFPSLPAEQRQDPPSALSRVKLHPSLSAVLERRVARRAGPGDELEAIDDFISLLADGEQLVRELNLDTGPTLPDWVVRQAGAQMQAQASELRAWIEGQKDPPAALYPEDDGLLLRLWQLRVGPLRSAASTPLRYAHLAIDEVQDLCPLEIQVALACLGPDRCATLAGDTQQQVVVGTGFDSWEDLFGRLGLQSSTRGGPSGSTIIETLRVSYRSTRPITVCGQRVLGPQRADQPEPQATRDGPPVEILRFTDHGACVAFLAEALQDLLLTEPTANVALIAPHADLARLYYEGLLAADVPRLRLVTEQDFSFAPGIDLAEVQDVKGLEFDYAVLLEVSARYYPDTDVARRLLHVAVTRAIHQLWITAVGTPAAPIRDLAPSDPPEEHGHD